MQATIPTQPPNHDPDHAARRAKTVISLSKLPPFHGAALKLLNISSDSGTAVSDFEMVFRTDPALTADLLLVANSALFGNRAKIGSIRHAITHLGLDRVRSLGSTIALSFFVRNQPRTAFVRHIWAHSIATAAIAEVLGNLYRQSDVYTAGLVHDLGRLGLLLSAGQNYEGFVTEEFPGIHEANQMERTRFGMNHCEAGSVVGHKWGFPQLLRNSMAAHHNAETAPPPDPLRLVQLACRMASAIGFPELPQMPEPFPELPEKARASRDLAEDRIRERINTQIEVMGR